MKAPKWTVLHTSISNDGIRSRNRTFFYNQSLADAFFRECQATDSQLEKTGADAVLMPTLRPYNHISDFHSLEQ